MSGVTFAVGDRAGSCLTGDFAAGLRGEQSGVHTYGSFATGMTDPRVMIDRTTGDFATGVRRGDASPAVGHFATGMAVTRRYLQARARWRAHTP